MRSPIGIRRIQRRRCLVLPARRTEVFERASVLFLNVESCFLEIWSRSTGRSVVRFVRKRCLDFLFRFLNETSEADLLLIGEVGRDSCRALLAKRRSINNRGAFPSLAGRGIPSHFMGRWLDGVSPHLGGLIVVEGFVNCSIRGIDRLCCGQQSARLDLFLGSSAFVLVEDLLAETKIERRGFHVLVIGDRFNGSLEIE
jgi:hypothetical protein